MKAHARWLLLALALFALVALLTPRDELEVDAPPMPEIPYGPTQRQHQRNATLKPRTTRTGVVLRASDPLLELLPANAKSVVVFDVSAILDSEIGRMLLRCMGNDDKGFGGKLAQMDRVAFMELENGHTLAVSNGDFAGDGNPFPLEGTSAPYGERAQVVDAEITDAGVTMEPARALWNDELLLWGDHTEDLLGALDQLETGSQTGPAIENPYGQVYGRADGELLRGMLPTELANRLASSQLKLEFHMNVDHDIGLAADAKGEPGFTKDVALSLASALAVARVKAAEEGDMHLARMLDTYAVAPNGNGFHVQAALPHDFVMRAFGKCAGYQEDGGVE